MTTVKVLPYRYGRNFATAHMQKRDTLCNGIISLSGGKEAAGMRNNRILTTLILSQNSADAVATCQYGLPWEQNRQREPTQVTQEVAR